jgi:hypothetical protein
MVEKVKQTKELLIRNSKGRSIYEVYYENGGELPRDLAGLYTSHKSAQASIDNYLIRKNRLTINNGSDTSK